MKKDSFWRRCVVGSLRVKSLLMLFMTMVIACGITFVIMFFSMRGQMYDFYSQAVEQRAHFLLQVYERSSLSPSELAALYNEGIGPVMIYDSFDQLPPLTGVIWESEMREGAVYLSAESDFPLGVVRLENTYLAVSAIPATQEISFVERMLRHTLLLCAATASICTIFTINHSIRPLTKLNAAIGQVGRGDFNVQVSHTGYDEIARIVENFNWMVGKLRGIESLQHDFVSSVSHEFKTPIAAISGSAKLLSATPHEKLTAQRVQKYTGMILKETARMSALSSNLLRLSRVENQSAAENQTSFSLDEQLRQSILLLESEWRAKRLQLDIQLEEVACHGNEELLAQVWINLLSNACKFTDPDGRIAIALRRNDHFACVTISDTGIGMDEQTRTRLFERFFQGDPSHSVGGNGLGLSIVKRILDLHSGRISFESVPLRGTTCTVQLPL